MAQTKIAKAKAAGKKVETINLTERVEVELIGGGKMKTHPLNVPILKKAKKIK